jgi:hypothetical protein
MKIELIEEIKKTTNHLIRVYSIIKENRNYIIEDYVFMSYPVERVKFDNKYIGKHERFINFDGNGEIRYFFKFSIILNKFNFTGFYI